MGLLARWRIVEQRERCLGMILVIDRVASTWSSELAGRNFAAR
jgi:hypothetical protein